MSDLVSGLYAKTGGPDFVKMKLGINKTQLMNWLKETEPDEKGFINVEICESKETKKLYARRDTWKPNKEYASSSGNGGWNQSKKPKKEEQWGGNPDDLDNQLPF